MPKTETISIRILKLLNLENEFEMSYAEYGRRIKETLATGIIIKSKITAEEADLLIKEYGRIKNKKGRFNIKSKKETLKKLPEPKKPKKPSKDDAVNFLKKPKKDQDAKIQEDKPEPKKRPLLELRKISLTVNKIHKNIQTLTKILASSDEKDRVQRIRSQRGRREALLEKKPFEGFINTVKKVLKPFKSIWNRIIQFLVFTFLGRLFTMFTDWAGNPENQKKVDTLKRLFTDFAPAIVGSAFLFLTPFGKFIRTIIGITTKLSSRLLLKGIPALIRMIRKNPKAALVITTALSAGKLYLDSRGAGEDAIKKKEEELGRKLTKEEETQAVQDTFLANPLLGPVANFMIPTLTEQVTADDEKGLAGSVFDSINQFLPDFSGIFTGKFNKGGVFSGIVDDNTGTRVSGFGKDTQFLPMANGKSGVVVQPGEIVMNKEQQEKLAADTGVDPREYVPGPKKGKIQKFNTGGIIGSNPNYKIAHDTISKNFPTAEPYHIAAALGNFETEAPGLKPNTYQLDDGPGRGIAQWEIDHDRNKFMGRWPTAEKMYGKGVINSLRNQLDFMKWEMNTGHILPDGRPNLPYGRNAKSAWLGTTNLTDATTEFMLGYEAPGTPHYAKRFDNAKQFLDLFQTFKPKQDKKLPKVEELPPVEDVGQREYHKLFDGLKNLLGFKGGGVKENSGIDIPGATDDRQLMALKVQPGEYLRVFTKDFVDRGGMHILDQLQSKLDYDSNARKSGIQPLNMKRYIPESPSTSNGGIQIVNLPTEVISSTQPESSTSRENNIPEINPISPDSVDTRMSIAKIYGIME